MMWRPQAGTPVERSGLLRRMHDEHALLAELLRALADAAHRGDTAAMTTLFNQIDKPLRDHLTLEDETILPPFSEADPAQALVLRDQHARIRRRLEDLGIALELHTLRAGMVDDFIELLYAHAVREERAMYAWLELALPLAEQHQLFSWIMGRLEDRLERPG
jgi:hypothetical protein